MELEDSIWPIFNSLLEDDLEKKLMRLIIRGKEPKEIIEELLEIKKKNKHD